MTNYSNLLLNEKRASFYYKEVSKMLSIKMESLIHYTFRAVRHSYFELMRHSKTKEQIASLRLWLLKSDKDL